MSNNFNQQFKVAIIDDSNIMRECINSCLTLWGYSVIIQAHNGKDFFDKLTDNKLPDICIVDINMPVMNGYETINALKKTWPDIKTILFSTDILKNDTRIIPNADAILSKSAGIPEIKSALQLLIEQIGNRNSVPQQ
jgi:DNA-binding NarL/FixJ family response regulator